MRNLTARKKFAALFSLTVFGIIIIFCFFFIGIFVITQYSQIKKDVYLEIDNITENHLAINNNALTYVKDSTGESLRQRLATTNISVAFYNSEYKVARAYGIFLTQGSSIDKQNPIFTIIDEAKNTGNTQEKRVILNNEEYLIVVTQIKTPGGDVLGFMVLADSLSPIYTSFSNLLSISMTLAILSLITSFWVGLLLMRAAYSSIKDITTTITKIDLNRLHHKLEEKGHKDDETYVLAMKFNEMVDRLVIATQKQKEFVANASHELKTPITRMITSIDAIDSDTTRKDPTVRYIRSQLFELAETIDELLLLARLREHAPPEGNVSIEKTITKVIEDNTIILKQKNITINKDTLPGLICPIPESYLKIIFSNLFNNAMKFSDDNGEIRIATSQEDDVASLAITNYGSTISREEKDKLFDRFFRASKSASTSGAGIGLAIVKSLCDMYEIEISVSSDSNPKGQQATTFVLTWKTSSLSI